LKDKDEEIYKLNKQIADLRNQINELNNQIKETVKNSDANVRVSSILPYVQEKLETFKSGRRDSLIASLQQNQQENVPAITNVRATGDNADRG